MTAAHPAAGRRKPLGGRLHRSSAGALALTGASAIRLLFQFGMLPVLARLIGPTEYGLVALAMPFIVIANVLSSGGMGTALGRERDVTVEREATVFWLSAAIGVSLCLLMIAAAFPMASLLRHERLTPLIIALSPILLMNSLTTVANGRIIRERRFAIFAASDLASTLAGTTAALAAAFAGWGAWSLVVQQLVLWGVKTLWVTRAAGTPVRAHYRFSEARALLLFGVHSIGAMLADFVARNLDSLIVGAALGATLLGYYAMGYQIVRMPDMLITGPFYLYIFTAVSRRLHDSGPGGTGDLAVGALRLGSAALAPLFCGLALVADLAVPVLLGSKWEGAVVPLRNLAGAGFSFCMCSLMAAVLMGLGKAALRLKLSVLLGVITIATVAAAVRFGLETVSAAAAVAMAAVFAVYLVVLTRELKVPLARALPALLPAVAASAVMAAVVLAVRAASAPLPEAAQLLLAILAGAASYPAVLAALARRRLLADARAFASAQADRVEPEAVERVAR